MTFVLHGTIGAVWFKKWWWACVLVWIQGALPDLIGIVGGSAVGHWELYNWAHQYHWFQFPFGWLHVWVDSFWHAANGDWYWWGYVAEVVIWVALIYIFRKQIGLIYRAIFKKKNTNSEAQDWTMQTK